MEEYQFPKDHFCHDSSIEWWYFWGKLNNNNFFHFATFRAGRGNLNTRSTHWSFHNEESNYYEELSDDFDFLENHCGYVSKTNKFYLICKDIQLSMNPERKPIFTQYEMNYYSIPLLIGDGMLRGKKVSGEFWLDHNWGSYRDLKNWDWISVRLDCGLHIMAFQLGEKKYSFIEFKDNIIYSDFLMDDRHLFLNALASGFLLKPLVEEKIFYPRFGIPYSEQPLIIWGKGEPIGYGIRERTYREEEKNG